jgi:Xaa-Pro aminopeptidase
MSMKYDRIDRELFKINRVKFTSKMQNGALAVFNSNDIITTSADSTMPFQQHRDIFYLSGVDQEESILVLFPSSSNENHREILFLKETSELIAIWEGEKLTKQTAYDVSGIKTVYWLNQFETIWKQLMAEATAFISIRMNTYEQILKQKQEKIDLLKNVNKIFLLIRYLKAHPFCMPSDQLKRKKKLHCCNKRVTSLNWE